MTTKEALRPCPFCGRQPEVSSRPGSTEDAKFVAFTVCMCGGYSARAHQWGGGDTDEAARSASALAWNTRASLPESEGMVSVSEQLLRESIEELAARAEHLEEMSFVAAAENLRAMSAWMWAALSTQKPVEKE